MSIIKSCMGICWWFCRDVSPQKPPDSHESEQRLISTAKEAMPTVNQSTGSRVLSGTYPQPVNQPESGSKTFYPNVLEAINNPVLLSLPSEKSLSDHGGGLR